MKTTRLKITKISHLKSVSVQIKEWFDKGAGNSYFSGIVTLNSGLPNEESIPLRFQYGYGSHSEYVAMNAIRERFPRVKFDDRPLWQLRDRKIPYTYCKNEVASQRKCEQFVE